MTRYVPLDCEIQEFRERTKLGWTRARYLLKNGWGKGVVVKPVGERRVIIQYLETQDQFVGLDFVILPYGWFMIKDHEIATMVKLMFG